ncbi:multidrug efflux SMR transporter [Anaerovorax odorimutans]|uniref:Multidrug efflux SMR transporter n=1 Tax=Anaerovorax odorimutans TaxID=109327 RepID=A0ABT1RIW5_9FIRM|nr:multidrug efflux SMR transporter [Anaerovorax odorimutans]MCQ4635123.1 multidrug efflux SMR transporter [Anaerovorax odorimutans]
MYNLFLAIAIGGELIGTTFLKYTEGFTKLWPSLVTIVSYGVCFYCFARALEHINLSFAYAIWSGLGIVVATLVSVFLFKQGITPAGIAGIVLILIGVVVLNLFGTPH